MDLNTLMTVAEGDIAKINAAVAPFANILAEASPIISLICPAGDLAIVARVIATIKAAETVAPDLEKNLLAVAANVQAIVAAAQAPAAS